jgi:MFS transporter, ACS family, tartrate transporter
VNSATALLSLRARRHIASRLLALIFFLYLIQIIDRFNISFAALRMKSELGFSDSVYGFGVSLFNLTYLAFGIPGVILVERWSARKWISCIVVSWGLITLLTAFIQNANEFYVVRLLLGAAEASFFPGIIIYLTHWFTQKDRARAFAGFYAAAPFGSFIGSAVAGWLLSVHLLGISGWRWLFIVEGIPAVIVGVITFFYLTDHPSEASWLPEDERAVTITELTAERMAKTKGRRMSFWDACKDSRLLLLMTGYFFFLMSGITNTFWMPTFLQRLSNLPAPMVARLVMLPAFAGVVGLLINSWTSDRSGERKWHTVIPIFGAGCCYLLIEVSSGHLVLVLGLITLYYFFYQGVYPTFWAIPSTFLSDTTAAALFGLVASVGGVGAFIGPSIVGHLNDATGSIHASLTFIGGSMLASAVTLLFLRTTAPVPFENERLNLSETAPTEA